MLFPLSHSLPMEVYILSVSVSYSSMQKLISNIGRKNIMSKKKRVYFIYINLQLHSVERVA